MSDPLPIICPICGRTFEAVRRRMLGIEYGPNIAKHTCVDARGVPYTFTVVIQRVHRDS